MKENRVTFLKEVEVPPHCFMSEALEWVAYGRVPELQYHRDSTADDPIDYRFYWREMPDNFRPSVEYRWFHRFEFESLNIPIDEEYFLAAEKCFGEDVELLPARITEYDEKANVYSRQGDASKRAYFQDLARVCRAKLAELRPLKKKVDAVEQQFKIYLDATIGKFLQLLAQGKLTAEALNHDRWEQLASAGQPEHAGKFVTIPSHAYSHGQKWPENELTLEGVRHVALRLNTQDILDNRSSLFNHGKSVNAERFGACYMLKTPENGRGSNRVGRKEVIDWQVLKSHLARLVSEGAIPESREACIYELIFFAEKNLGKAPSRSAVQNNLRNEFDAIYAKN